MTSNGSTEAHRHAVIGSAKTFWIFDSETGFDLTHPSTPTSAPINPRVTIDTTTSPITIDPANTALLVIDMQNYFLHEALGRAKGTGHKACEQLVAYAVPAARKAGIRVIWVNWGLTDEEIEVMPPSILRAFGFIGDMDGQKVPLDKYGNAGYRGGDQLLEDGRAGRKYGGMGSPMGKTNDPKSGEEIDLGKLLMRDQWNSALYPPLDDMYEEGSKLPSRPDLWVHKNRMSGMWGPTTALEEVLEREGIKTIFFAGVNTDQCVGGTYQDSFSKGYDCILLSDGCGTTSPNFAQQCVEHNAENTWGFQTSCKAFAEGVEKMQ